MTRRDTSFKNTRHGEHLQVPIYSNDPPVSHGGELYWNSTDECMYYSTGVNSWECIINGMTGMGATGATVKEFL
jgi:hypothetical protein